MNGLPDLKNFYNIHPSEIFQSLETLTYTLRSQPRNSESHYLRSVLSIITFEDISNVPQSISIHLHQTMLAPTEIVDSWKSAIHGMCGIVLGVILTRKDPSECKAIIQDNIWILSKLKSMLRYGSELEKYGSLVALESILKSVPVFMEYEIINPSKKCMSGGFSQTWSESYIRDMIKYLLDFTNYVSKVNRKATLFMHIRWKMAFWKTLFQIVNILAISPIALNQVLLESKNNNEPEFPIFHDGLPLRKSFRFLSESNALSSSMLAILKYINSCAPLPHETKTGTLFSGPGAVFSYSGLKLEDLSIIVKNVIYFLSKLVIQDAQARTFYREQCGILRLFQELSRFFDPSTKTEMTSFLMIVGYGSPLCGMKWTKMRDLILGSGKDGESHLLNFQPEKEFLGLQALSNYPPLLETEEKILFLENGGLSYIIDLLRNSNNNSAMNHTRVCNFRIQKSPTRDAIPLNPSITWRNVLKGYAAFTFGKFLRYLLIV